jgi:hypothetical protein
MEHTNALCGHKAEFEYIKPDCIYSYDCVINKINFSIITTLGEEKIMK